MPKRALFIALLFLSHLAWAQQRPLITEDVEIVKPGSVRIEFGFDFAQRKRYPVSGLQGDLSRLGVASVTFGLAPNVEVEAGGVIHNSLAISRRDASAIPLNLKNTNSTSDVGDFFLATKIKIRNETKDSYASPVIAQRPCRARVRCGTMPSKRSMIINCAR